MKPNHSGIGTFVFFLFAACFPSPARERGPDLPPQQPGPRPEEPDREAMEKMEIRARESLEKPVTIKSPEEGMSIAALLEELRRQAGLDYIVSAEVGGMKVIINVEEKPVRAVLGNLARSTGLDWEMPPNEMIISLFNPKPNRMDFFPPAMHNFDDEGPEGAPRFPGLRHRPDRRKNADKENDQPKGDADVPDDRF